MTYDRLVLLLFAASSLVLPAPGQSRRLNGPLPRPGGTDLLEDFALSADGARLVFRADALEDETFELFSSPADASGPPLRLSAPLVEGGDVVRFALGNQRAAYMADQDEDEVFELYSVPITGGAALELSGTLVGGGDVLDLLLVPDGTSAVFLADGLVDGRPEFFRVPLDGAAPSALDPSPTEDQVTNSRISPDGARLLFTRRHFQNPGTFGQFHIDGLFSLALDGSQSKVLLAVAHAPRQPMGDFISRTFVDLEFSPDGQRAVYTDQVEGKDGPDEVTLNSALVDGSQAPAVLSQGASNSFLSFTVSPSLARAVFFELGNAFSIALDGTARLQLDPPGWTPAYLFALTPDGTSVLFDARNSSQLSGLLAASIDGSLLTRVLHGPGDFTLMEIAPTDSGTFFAARNGPVYEYLGFTGVYAAPLDGSAAPVLLNGPDVERTGGSSLQPAPGGELVFRNSYSIDTNLDLYTVPADGSQAPRRISATMSNGRDVDRYLLAPDGTGVVYRADQTNDGAFELFRTSLSGGAPVNFLPLSPGPVVGDVLSFRVAPDGSSLVFWADQDTDEEFRLYRVPASGRASPTRVGRFPLAPGPYQDEFAFTPAGDRVVRFNTKTSSSLYIVGTEPGSLEVDIGHAEVAGPLEFTPDGTRLVFTRTQVFSGTELVRTALDGSGLVTLFRVSLNSVPAYVLTPDGSTVVFVADATVEGKFDLFRIPVAGGAPAIQLDPVLASNRDVTAFRITPGGSEVLYLADQRADGVFELFLVPLDQSRPPRRLSSDLVSLGDVVDFVFTPGKRVVYRADAAANNRFDLFSVSLAPTPRALPQPPGSANDVEPDVARLTFLERSMVQPDYRVGGRQVFFRADVFRPPGLVPDRPELFRVPLLGGQAPLRLSRPVQGGQVLSFRLAPDETRIVYLADEGNDGVNELYSVGVSGGEVIALDPLPAFADVSDYRITPDSRDVVYRCDREQDEAWQLFRAPIDGSAPPRVVNDLIRPGGDVQADFAVLPDGSVVYRADQAGDEVFELFASFSRSQIRSK